MVNIIGNLVYASMVTIIGNLVYASMESVRFRGMFFRALGCAAVIMLVPHLSPIEASVENNKLDDVTSPDLSKKGRFVTFNNDDGEVKIELDFAVPFMKIPTSKRREGNLIQPSLNVNANGLVTVGAMLLVFVTLVPKIVQLFIPQAQATATQNLIPLIGRLDETLRNMDIPTTDCYQKSACWVASNAMAYPFASSKNGSAQWLGSFIENDAMQQAFQHGLNGGDCTTFKCPLSMNAISQILKFGRRIVGNDIADSNAKIAAMNVALPEATPWFPLTDLKKMITAEITRKWKIQHENYHAGQRYIRIFPPPRLHAWFDDMPLSLLFTNFIFNKTSNKKC
ncbi:hypothetical protein GE061_001696 [Apolygus lucorum]|uniref:Uncharacterized protein n=1 Tax=Apolygus lucorum TaxID=248454 RepID=A0A8S9Y7T1_APOLU|nr:hypothetical protein GE061_001696 [Apolygus lucorum]